MPGEKPPTFTHFLHLVFLRTREPPLGFKTGLANSGSDTFTVEPGIADGST